eukprot:5023760-Amphidinium_carterae.3
MTQKTHEQIGPKFNDSCSDQLFGNHTDPHPQRIEDCKCVALPRVSEHCHLAHVPATIAMRYLQKRDSSKRRSEEVEMLASGVFPEED